jgi:isoquinoline 1-oxidoreductase beta subunit
VKLLWSREEDMQHGQYRPVALIRQKAALDAEGNLIGWHARIAAQSWVVRVRPHDIKDGLDLSGAQCYHDSPYAVPNLLVEYSMRNTHVPVGPWRSVVHSQNPFFRECFLEELIHAAGKDAYEYRRNLLAKTSDPNVRRYRDVLDACAKAAQWDKPLPSGVHRGIAVVDAYGSYAAGVVELSVGPNKQLDIKRIVIAVDPGYVVNTDAADAQIESNVVYGLTAAMWGEINIRNGRAVESNFHDYPMMLIKHMPKVVGVLVPTGGFWGGMGEPPLTPVAPALCNAIFAATGERVRSLPLKNHGYRI